MAMNSVAAASCHQYPSTSSACASLSMVPQETWSTGTPRPRNDRITSTLMKATTSSDIRTRITWLTLGRMCTNMRVKWPAPIASAARTYSRPRCFMYSARTCRYMPVQPVSPRIRITVSMPRPSTAAKAKISRMSGIEVKTL